MVPPEKYLAAANMVPHTLPFHMSACLWPTCWSTVKPMKPWPKLLHNYYICSNYLPSMYIPSKNQPFCDLSRDCLCTNILYTIAFSHGWHQKGVYLQPHCKYYWWIDYLMPLALNEKLLHNDNLPQISSFFQTYLAIHSMAQSWKAHKFSFHSELGGKSPFIFKLT